MSFWKNCKLMAMDDLPENVVDGEVEEMLGAWKTYKKWKHLRCLVSFVR